MFDIVVDGRKEIGDVFKDEEFVIVFSDWSDDSFIGDDVWLDVNELEIFESKLKIDDKECVVIMLLVWSEVLIFDDVYDLISDDEFDVMLGDDDEDVRVGVFDSKGLFSVFMVVEDVDWSVLVFV